MSVAFVDTGHGFAFSNSSSFSMTITAGTRAIVQVGSNLTTGTFSCDIGGTPGVAVSSSEASGSTGNHAQSFVVDSPPSGSQTVAFATTDASSILWCNVATASGSASVGNGTAVASDIDADGVLALAMTSANGDMSVTMAVGDGTGAFTSNYGQDWQLGQGAGDHKTPVTDVNPTHTWTKNTVDTIVVTGANFVQSGGASSPPMFRGS